MLLPDVYFFPVESGTHLGNLLRLSFENEILPPRTKFKKKDFVAAAEMKALNCQNSARLKGSFFGQMYRMPQAGQAHNKRDLFYTKTTDRWMERPSLRDRN